MSNNRNTAILGIVASVAIVGLVGILTITSGSNVEKAPVLEKQVLQKQPSNQAGKVTTGGSGGLDALFDLSKPAVCSRVICHEADAFGPGNDWWECYDMYTGRTSMWQADRNPIAMRCGR